MSLYKKLESLWIVSLNLPPIPTLYYLQKLQKERTNSVLMGKKQNVNFVETRQNTPSGIRLSGVPPLYFLQKLQKYRTNSVFMGENQNRNFVENREDRPSDIRFTGVLPPSIIN